MQKKYLMEIKEILLSNLSRDEKIKRLEDYHKSDIADVLESFTEEERLKVYKIFNVSQLADIFPYYDNAKNYVQELNPEISADILEKMDSDEAMDILDELKDEDKNEIIGLLEKNAQKKIIKLDSYDDQTVGSHMSDNYIVIKKSLTIKEAMSCLVKEAGEHDNIYTIYVVDDENKFYGIINLKDLIIARKEDDLLSLCKTSYPTFYDDEIMSDCLKRMKDYGEISIPIISRENCLLGVITPDILLEANEEELIDDYAKLGGLSENEDFNESAFVSVKKRIPWLVILMFLGLLVSSIVGTFEAVITALPAVVFFQSMILDMAGNVGTQSLAVTIRNISEGMSEKDKIKSVFKEIKIGFINGIIIGTFSFVFIMLFLIIKHQEVVTGVGYNLKDVVKVSLIIGTSLLLSMTVSSLIGAMFPIILDKVHIDPAVASGPFITTFNDIIAVVSYYGLVYLAFILLL